MTKFSKENIPPVALPFALNNEYCYDGVEFNIRFDRAKNSLDNLIEFVQKYPHSRINISFPAGVHIPTLITLQKVSNYKTYARLSEADIGKVQELVDNDLFFFFDSTLCASNYTNLEAMIRCGVSDIYIADDLCYDLDEVIAICDSCNVGLRLILNRIPATSFDRGTCYSSPIYRPQDIDLLMDYFSTFEFDCGTPYDWAEADVLMRAWFDRKHWHGDLSEINKDLQFHFPNDSVVPEYTRYKINCERRCAKRIRNHCRKCRQFIEIGQVLRENNVALVTDGQK